MEIFKVLGICLITAVLAVVLKGYKGEYALLLILGSGTVIALYIINALTLPIDFIKAQLSDYGVKYEYFGVILKSLGIAYVTSFIADACRDSGLASLASKAELAGKCAVFILSLPLLSSVLNTALGLIK